MRRLLAITSFAASVVALAGPAIVAAQPYDQRVDAHRAEARYSRRHYDSCKHARNRSANTGTVAGALVGGASGALIGGNALGALVGAGVGAVGGHEIAKSRVHC